ncbi:MAG: N-6 DNA methylase, partial [Ilumatobacteraceae bacterium]
MPSTRRTRRQLGAWYTPEALLAHVLDETLPAVLAESSDDPIRVLDPACGDGRFLVEAGERIRAAGRVPELVGIDVDAGAVRSARVALAAFVGRGDARVVRADALTRRWSGEPFDLVVGNPPFLSPLGAEHADRPRTRASDTPYANAAFEFLELGARLARPDGGRVAFV